MWMSLGFTPKWKKITIGLIASDVSHGPYPKYLSSRLALWLFIFARVCLTLLAYGLRPRQLHVHEQTWNLSFFFFFFLACPCPIGVPCCHDGLAACAPLLGNFVAYLQSCKNCSKLFIILSPLKHLLAHTTYTSPD